jgi:hypothetical protein
MSERTYGPTKHSLEDCRHSRYPVERDLAEDVAQLRAELEQARAERDEAVARLGRADFMVDAAFERGRASTLIEQHGSISEVEAKPAPAPAAGAVGVERLRAMAEEWHKPADRRRFIDDKTRGGFELGRDECADELLALANEAAADGEG